MNNQSQDQLKKMFLEKLETFTRQENEFIRRVMERRHVTRNINREFDEQLTFGQKLADNVAKFGGSWTFIIIFALILVMWVILNSVILARYQNAFDPYPYILLNLFLSMLASIQAPIIMMSQNRMNQRDRRQADQDFRVNLKAEIEVATLHEKVDHLLHAQWNRMVELQQLQLDLLQELARRRGSR